MGSKTGLAELKMRKEDGSLLSRLEMEQQLREESVHHRRLRASKLGLPTKTAQHMLPISVTHWLLDHWVANGTITGEILGVRSEFDADDNKDYLRQLTQRLVLFIEHKLAVTPNPGEGIDMANVNMPPGFPPMPPGPPAPNGQQGMPQFTPPPPPPMPGMPGVPPMPFPQQPAPSPQPQVYPQQQPAMTNVMPPGMMPGMPPIPQPPQPPQPMVNPVPQQQGYPTMMPQMAPPQQVAQQPMQQGQMAVPTKADPSRQWNQAGKRENGEQRTRRTKEELAEDAVYETWVKAGGDPNVGAVAQAQAPQPGAIVQATIPQGAPTVVNPQPAGPPMMVAPPNPFGGGAPTGIPGMPPMPGMPQPQHMQAPAPTPQAAPQAQVSLEQFNALQKQIKNLSSGVAMLIRIAYQKPGAADLEDVLKNVCGVNPQ